MSTHGLRFQPCEHCCTRDCLISEDPIASSLTEWEEISGVWYPGASFRQGQGVSGPALLYRPQHIMEPAYVLTVNWQIFASQQFLEMSVAVEDGTLDGLTVLFAPGHNGPGSVALLDYDRTTLGTYVLSELNFQDVIVSGRFSVCIEPIAGQYYITATSHLSGRTAQRNTFVAYYGRGALRRQGEHRHADGIDHQHLGATIHETANEEKPCPACTQLGCWYCNNGITSKCLKLTFDGIVPAVPHGSAECDCNNREFILSWSDCGTGRCLLPFYTRSPDVDPLFIGYICEGPGSCGEHWFAVERDSPDGNIYSPYPTTACDFGKRPARASRTVPALTRPSMSTRRHCHPIRVLVAISAMRPSASSPSRPAVRAAGRKAATTPIRRSAHEYAAVATSPLRLPSTWTA